VYGNVIQNGYGKGIGLIGLGGRVYNNIIVNPGRGFDADDARASGIHIHLGTADASYEVVQNTIINPTSYGIRFTYRFGTANVIRDNIIVNPGNTGDSPFINIGQGAGKVKVENNKYGWSDVLAN